jgi:hypothetical protein
MIRTRSLAAMILLSLSLPSCASQAALIESLAKDPASNCVVLSTPYGGILIARATPGIRVQLAGGTCSIDSAPVR